jgi:hypothetical protein
MKGGEQAMFTTERLTTLAGILVALYGLQKLLAAIWGVLPAGASAGVVLAAGLVELAGGLLIARVWRLSAAAALR